MSRSEPAAHLLQLREQGDHEGALAFGVRQCAVARNDAELHYQTACVHDFLGLEVKAVVYYVKSIELGLSGEALRGACLGLGSTYRALGQYQKALDVFNAGLVKFPDARELKLFRAMALYNLGEAKLAVESMLRLIADDANDPYLKKYSRAISFYAKDVDRVWPESLPL